jgi:hypothetical protein
MSLVRLVVVGCVFGWSVVSARAQDASSSSEPSDSPEAEQEEDEGKVDLRASLSAFGYAEKGRNGPPLVEDGAVAENPSPQKRAFGDLRVRMDATNIAGSKVQTKVDARIRQTIDGRFQSGFAPGNEYDLKESYVAYRGSENQLILGRQILSMVAASKIDGLSYQRLLSDRWKYALFAGTFPQRGSRSLKTDYPREDESGRRSVLPVVGSGASYQRPRLHGDVGIAAVMPYRKRKSTGVRESPRVQANSNGYWMPAQSFNLVHYLLVDLSGPSGAGVRNANVEASAYPVPELQLSLGANHQDNEFLEITARNQLETPDLAAQGVVQNSATLARVSAQSLRAGASLAMAKRRFELTLTGSLRRRPEFTVVRPNGEDFTFPGARSAEGTLTFLDRRSLAQMRMAASASVLRALGDGLPTRSNGYIGRLSAGHALGSAGEWEVDVAAMSLRDQMVADLCDGQDPLLCFGGSRVRAGQAGGMLTYWGQGAWLVVLDLHAGAQKVTTEDAMGETVRLPTVLTGSAFVRIGWRNR